MNQFRTLEEQLFNSAIDLPRTHKEIIFIVGAPRTGSTLLYLLMIRHFHLTFFPNFVNDNFYENPAIGMMMWLAEMCDQHFDVTLENRYGHTVGLSQPSEATRIFKKWFEDSATSKHLADTLDFLAAVIPSPLVIKNAWNCFRIADLATEYPSAKFVWIRRGIEAAALSDLNARYVTAGSPSVWTPVTPPNVGELADLPYAQQVVENQRAFEREIYKGLSSILQPSRWTEVWFEKLIENNAETLKYLGSHLGLYTGGTPGRYFAVDELSPRPAPELPEGDRVAVKQYAQAQKYEDL